MRLFSLLICVLLLSAGCKNNDPGRKPNIILILADDLGYGELGCYGQKKIETPNIDKLAKRGVVFTQSYSGSPVCAPSRCVLLSGQHTGNSYIRGNDEWNERGEVWNYREMLADSTLEGQRPLPDSLILLPKVLQSVGYSTAMFGKWGLGAPHTNSIPNNKGFDYFLGYNCQRQAHTYLPLHLYENEKRIYLNNDTVPPHTKLDPKTDLIDENSYIKFTHGEYAPDVIFDGLLDFVENKSDEPFFIYWATPIPHVPLQAPAEWINYYRDKFGDEKPYNGGKGYFPVRYPNATYAAMISYLDMNIGKLIEKLKSEGKYENTIIIFTSDNGPTFAGGVDVQFFNSAGVLNHDPGRIKASVYEGGIRVPTIISWPGNTDNGGSYDGITSFPDLYQTIIEFADAQQPGKSDGLSLIPTLTGEGQQKKHEYLYWEFPERNGMQAVRMGNWKAIRKNIKAGDLTIELYDIETDPMELSDISMKYPEIVEKISEIMDKEHEEPKVDLFKMKALGDK